MNQTIEALQARIAEQEAKIKELERERKDISYGFDWFKNQINQRISELEGMFQCANEVSLQQVDRISALEAGLREAKTVLEKAAELVPLSPSMHRGAIPRVLATIDKLLEN